MFSLNKKQSRREQKYEQLIGEAGEATALPSEPEGGIPKQWLPAWMRWPIRALILPFLVLDGWAQRLARLIVRPPYKKEGKCHQRGNCCHYILIPQPVGWLERVHYFWHTQINGFFLRSPDPVESDDELWVVMGCRYLRKNGSCSRYRWRPSICRSWPRIEYFGRPQTLKGCGFRPVLRTKYASSESKLRVID